MHFNGQDLSGPLSIVHTLRQHGYEAYFAGGWVRDYLLGRSGSDVDIATNATPDEIALLFEKTVPVGASFGVMIVVVEGTPYEVATFRQDGGYQDGRRPDSVSFCSHREDALRRDFTINGMFFDPITRQVIDHVGGQEDLRNHVLRAIGDPSQRFREDHLRMLRAVRFATRLGFPLEERTEQAIRELGPLIQEGVSVERIAQELAKMAQTGDLLAALRLMRELGLLDLLFPHHQTLPAHLESDLPLILQLCSLYRSQPGEAWPALAERLKLSGEEKRMAQTLVQAHELLSQPDLNRVTWAHYLARPWAEECLEALFCWGGPFPHGQKEVLELIEELEEHTHRVVMRQPLVTAADLLALGIPAGPQMGHWMKEAERIAIEQDLDCKEEVLRQLPRFNSSE
jgi:poly(A) polymerase